MVLRYGSRARPSTLVSEWTPSYPGIPLSLVPHLWLDAADLSTITSSPKTLIVDGVSEWRDKSGNGYHVTQSTSSSRPTTGSTLINQRNVLGFDSAAWLRSTGSTNLNVGNVTVFTVFGETSSGNNKGIISAFDTSGGSDWTTANAFAVTTASSPRSYAFERNGNSGSGFVTGSKPSTFGVYSTQANSSGFNQSWYNGNTAGSGTITGTFGVANGGFLVGSRWLTGSVSTLDEITGSIAEIIIYSRVLTTAEMASVHNYLKNKWGIV